MTNIKDLIRDFGKECVELKDAVEFEQRSVLDDDLHSTEEVLQDEFDQKLEELMEQIAAKFLEVKS